MAVVELGAHSICYREVGSGPPVVLLHSGGLGGRQWARLMGRLAGAHRVIAPDLLGTGGSSAVPHDAAFHFHEDVDVLTALLEALDVGPCHIVGHSYGGLVGLTHAKRAPSAVRSLALFEPVAFGVLYSAGDEAAIHDLEGEDADGRFFDDAVGGEEPWLRRFIDWWQGPGAWDGLSDAARDAFRGVGRKVFQEVRSLTADRTPHHAYEAIDVPALLMTADGSPLAARRVARVLADTLPRGRLRVFEDAGHMAPLTHGHTVNEVIGAHLEAARSGG